VVTRAFRAVKLSTRDARVCVDNAAMRTAHCVGRNAQDAGEVNARHEWIFTSLNAN